MTALMIEDAHHPYDAPNIPSSDWRGPWYHHPGRPCKDRDEYADLTLIPRAGREAEAERMRLACLTCPVLRECREDMLATMSDYEMYGVRAGFRGKT